MPSAARLFVSLGLLGLGLVLAVLRAGALRPAAAARHAGEPDGDPRGQGGAARRANFPPRSSPVADELNLLIQSNAEIVERARTQVGNLAHALKTPLSVLTNEAAAHKTPACRQGARSRRT